MVAASRHASFIRFLSVQDNHGSPRSNLRTRQTWVHVRAHEDRARSTSRPTRSAARASNTNSSSRPVPLCPERGRLSSMRWRWHLKWLAVLFLIGAAINVPFAVFATESVPRRPLKTIVNDFGAKAALYNWPGPRPSGQPAWPAPTQYSIEGRFGYRHYNVFSTVVPQTTQFQMEVSEAARQWPVCRKQGATG